MTSLNAHWRWHNLAPVMGSTDAHWCPDIISRTSTPTVAANQQTNDDVDPQQPDAANENPEKDEFDASTDSDEEIDVVTRSSPVTVFGPPSNLGWTKRNARQNSTPIAQE